MSEQRSGLCRVHARSSGRRVHHRRCGQGSRQNMKTMALERDVYGEGQHRCHGGFLGFAKHCGFVIKLCQLFRARTKGKVERFNGYLRRSFSVSLPSRLTQTGPRHHCASARRVRPIAGAMCAGSGGMNVQQKRIAILCEELRLAFVAQGYGAAAQKAAEGTPYSDFLDGLLRQEAAAVMRRLLMRLAVGLARTGQQWTCPGRRARHRARSRGWPTRSFPGDAR